MKTVLYISYDGMTDPLGQSQVIPYLAGLAKRGHSITALSAEKPHHFALLRERCERIFADHAIDWHHVPYSKRPPVLATCVDLPARRAKRREEWQRRVRELAAKTAPDGYRACVSGCVPPLVHADVFGGAKEIRKIPNSESPIDKLRGP